MFRVLLGAIALLSTFTIHTKTAYADPGTQEPETLALDQPFTVDDLLAFTELGDPNSTDWRKGGVNFFEYSPDGSKAVVVVTRGDRTYSGYVSSLLLFDLSTLEAARDFKVLETISSQGWWRPISFVRWADDNSISYLAAREGAPPQIEKYILTTQSTLEISSSLHGVKSYTLSADQKWWLLGENFDEADLSIPGPNCNEIGCRMVRGWITESALGYSRPSVLSTRGGARFSFISPDGRQIPIALKETDLTTQFCWSNLRSDQMPQSGSYALLQCRLSAWPASWNDYSADPSLQSFLNRGSLAAIDTYFLAEASTGQAAPLAGVPDLLHDRVSRGVQPRWHDGDKYILFAGALPPMTLASRFPEYQSQWGIVLYERETKRAVDFAPFGEHIDYVSSFEAGPDDSYLVTVKKDDFSTALCLRIDEQRLLIDEQCQSSPRDRMFEQRLSVRQSPAEPPILFYRSSKTAVENQVFDPNEHLRSKLPAVEDVTWKFLKGREWGGHLYYPHGFESGERYPLVVLTHSPNLNNYMVSGYVNHFAASALTGRGIFVLQLSESYRTLAERSSSQQYHISQSGYIAGIQHLVDRGLVDRDKVGIVGFSASGTRVASVLSKSDFCFAAAAFTVTADIGPWYYLRMGAPEEFDQRYYGAPLFGEGRKDWVSKSPFFSIENVETPLLMYTRKSEPDLWDWFVMMDRQNKPVEYWLVPELRHDVFEIGRRRFLNGLYVDWFDFWLNRVVPEGTDDDMERTKRWQSLENRDRCSVE